MSGISINPLQQFLENIEQRRRLSRHEQLANVRTPNERKKLQEQFDTADALNEARLTDEAIPE